MFMMQPIARLFHHRIRILSLAPFSDEERLGPDMPAVSTKVQLGILLILCFLSFFSHLSAFEVDLMEARNFVTAREIASGGSWLVPTMNGELRISKPPLPTWITTAVYDLGGRRQDEGVLRIPAALMASLMVLSVWGLVRCLSSDAILPLVSAAVLATSLILLDMGRRNTWDIYSHSFMAAALWSLVSALRSPKVPWLRLQVFGLLLAAAFLCKGPVPFYALLLPFLVAFGRSYGFGELKQKWPPLALGVVIFVLLSAAWPLYLLKYHPAQIQAVFSQETAAWGSRHVQPLYFYLHFPLYTGLWFLGVVAGLWPRFGKPQIQPFFRYRFILIWLLATILLLSVIPEKKERYLLPAAIPMAILAGSFWRSLLESGRSRTRQLQRERFLKTHAALILLVVLAALFILIRSGMTSNDPHYFTFLLPAGIFLGILIFCVHLLRQPKASVLFVSTLVLSCTLTLLLIPAIATSPLYIRNYGYQPLDEARQLEPLHAYELYQAGRINMKDVWKVGKPIHPWAEIKNRLDRVDLPVVLMSEGNPAKDLPDEFSQRIQMESLGCYRSDYRRADKTKCFVLVTPTEQLSQ
jgi:4-amino-4-deoxy-L-arabinose transferase-like glycosyltransferase